MAYLNYLLAAPEAEVLALSHDPTIVLEPSLVVGVSHLIAYWVEVQPLGQLLGQAIDGGLTIHPDLWHPLRVPVYHGPEAARALYQQLADEWQRALAERPVPEDDWYRVEIERVLSLYRHASDRAESVVSVLAHPADRGRSRKVRIPFKWRGGKR